ncbi:hypothetical protein [Streptomyces pinistramenti]|uniref:hypothetical protein n=1 Tax=Streptomyces pinistramenti TaxID=2884812 RepID=UPI0027E519E6|nr:hypothetical protein [Streptomyces pinistramenti]
MPNPRPAVTSANFTAAAALGALTARLAESGHDQGVERDVQGGEPVQDGRRAETSLEVPLDRLRSPQGFGGDDFGAGGAAAAVAMAWIEAVVEAVVFGFMTRMRLTLQRFGGFHGMDSRFRAAERSYGHWPGQEIAAIQLSSPDELPTKTR